MKKKLFLLVSFLVGFFTSMSAEEVNLYIADATATAGSSVTVPVMMTGCAATFQLEVHVPSGVTLSKVQRGEVVKERDDDDEYYYTFISNKKNGGTIILCYSVINKATTSAGEVAKLVLDIDENLAPGEYKINMVEAECGLGPNVLSTYSEKSSTLTITNATAINEVGSVNPEVKATHYNVNGQKVSRTNKGLNIIKYRNGATKKVVVK